MSAAAAATDYTLTHPSQFKHFVKAMTTKKECIVGFCIPFDEVISMKVLLKFFQIQGWLVVKLADKDYFYDSEDENGLFDYKLAFNHSMEFTKNMK